MTFLGELFLCDLAFLVVTLQLHERPEHLTGTVDETVAGTISKPALYIQSGHCIIVQA
jgi:hypothetical protein